MNLPKVEGADQKMTQQSSTLKNSESVLLRGIEPGHFVLEKLREKPDDVLQNKMGGVDYSIKIIVPEYENVLQQHYESVIKHNFDHYYQSLGLPHLFKHFGLAINFHKPVELQLHDKDMVLPDNIKQLIKEFGCLITRNVHLDNSVRNMGHKNRFPQLNFHIDRKKEQGSYYSAYTRNPFDQEQYLPRTSSTLFLPPLAAYFQSLVEGQPALVSEGGLIVNTTLFDSESIVPLLNKITIEHTWDEPAGTGELSIIDNCTMLHASYYPNIHNKGYRIGVRYLS